MAKYQVLFARSARRDLESLEPSIVNRVFAKIQNLANITRPFGSRKLRGENNLWRLRVGDYRIIYCISDKKKIVDVTAVRHRSEAYK